MSQSPPTEPESQPPLEPHPQPESPAHPPDDALSTLIEHRERFLAFLQSRTGSRDDAEEILQAAYLRSVEKADTIRDDESVVAWFYRLLRNALTDAWRRRDVERRGIEARARELRDPGEEGDGPDAALENAICACVSGLVPLLAPGHRSMIERVDLGDQAVGAAGRDLGITSGNARVRLHRARAALRREVERACGACAEHGCLDCSCARPSTA